MKEYVEVLKDSFLDYAGKEHHFTLAAISEMPDNYTLSEDSFGIEKVLKIGLAICNPDDVFDEKVGACTAIGRAKKSEPVLYSTIPGLINTKMVQALLEQEAEYIKNNPEQYIAGYNEAKERWEKRKQIEELKSNFSPIEKTIVEEVNKNPKFLDNVQKYLEYCQKHSK